MDRQDSIERQILLRRLRATRNLSTELCAPLKPEDYRIQSMPDVSPPWWNLGHTTWFFAKNILEPFGRYSDADARLEYVLNSYYESLGERLPRHQRGLVTRPTTDEIYDFRQSVDARLEALLEEASQADFARLAFLVRTGIEHEQQHQELLVTELKHILGTNPRELREPYAAARIPASATPDVASSSVSSPQASLGRPDFLSIDAGLYDFGNLEGGWCWDNEMPVHKAYLDHVHIADRLVTNREYLAFLEDGGYRDPLLWLSNGWAAVQAEGWQAPLYWYQKGGATRDAWHCWTLQGDRPLELDEPVCHISFYEADAYARWLSAQGETWRGVRLPTEREWEKAARLYGQKSSPPASGTFLDDLYLHPRGVTAAAGAPQPPEADARNPQPPGADARNHQPPEADTRNMHQALGDVWEWTTSHYEPYPRYRPFDGALMEYNGKFMDNQRVLRGGSCATPANHIRVSYRNFWPADTRFQFTGIRLARDPA